MRTLNEDAIEYAANNLFTTELGYTEIIWGPEIAPEGSRMQEREFNEVVLRGRQRHSLRRMRLVKTPSEAIGMIVANTKRGRKTGAFFCFLFYLYTENQNLAYVPRLAQ
jgi:hypothetical protein